MNEEWLKEAERLLNEYASDLSAAVTSAATFDRIGLRSHQKAADESRAALVAHLAGAGSPWVLAMADALGADSGYSIPIKPDADAFRTLFSHLARAAVPAVQPQEPVAWMTEAKRLLDEYTSDLRAAVMASAGFDRIGLRSHTQAANESRAALLAHFAARPLVQQENAAERVCYQAYVIVGQLLMDLGIVDEERSQNLLTNLAEARVVHADLIPWGSVQQENASGVKTVDGGQR